MKKREQKIAATLLVYKRLFETEDGKKVLTDLINSCHILGSSFDENPYVTAYNEGARSVVTRILAKIKTDPDQLKKMIEQGNQGEEE